MSISRQAISMDDVLVDVFAFEGSNGVNEYYGLYAVRDNTWTYEEQVRMILSISDEILDSEFYGQMKGLKNTRPCFKRYFLSDAANQVDILKGITGEEDCAVSYIQQPPLSGAKIGMWVHYMTGTENHKIDDHLYCVSHDGYDELWSTQNTATGIESFTQTEKIFAEYGERLKKVDCNMADNCVRTWFYVNDIDNQYPGVVKARNMVFDAEGLTDDTHYIASTGIGGKDSDPKVYCKMDSIAIKGIKPEQVHYLYALDHLNRTSEYGVRFERGTYVDFADRRRVYISGTASINNKGEIMYPGDIRKQVERMWDNIEALLKEADCTFENVTFFIVYLRDQGDYEVVERMFHNRFYSSVPYIILHAPVCRPGWLVESECIAIKKL